MSEATSSPSTAPDGRYGLARDAAESERLNRQHAFMKRVFDGRLLHPDIKLAPGANVLESGTGTAIWLQELAQGHPDLGIKAGYDISPLQFPDPENSRGLELFTHSVLEPLPAKHQAKYDFIHQRLLILGLKKEEWPTAVSTLYNGLKPGGQLQLVELVMRVDSANPHAESLDIINLWHRIFELVGSVSGRDGSAFLNLEGYMTRAGFQDICSWPVKLPIGALNPDKTMQEATVAYCIAAAAAIRGGVAAKTPELLPEEVRESAGAAAKLKELEQYLRMEGGYHLIGMVIGRKAS